MLQLFKLNKLGFTDLWCELSSEIEMIRCLLETGLKSRVCLLISKRLLDSRKERFSYITREIYITV